MVPLEFCLCGCRPCGACEPLMLLCQSLSQISGLQLTKPIIFGIFLESRNSKQFPFPRNRTHPGTPAMMDDLFNGWGMRMMVAMMMNTEGWMMKKMNDERCPGQFFQQRAPWYLVGAASRSNVCQMKQQADFNGYGYMPEMGLAPDRWQGWAH